MNMTLEKKECAVLPANVGESTTDVPLIITQDPANPAKITAQVKGAAVILLSLFFGTDTFNGTVTGTDLDFIMKGTVASTEGGCTFTRDAHLVATLEKDTLVGTMTYTYVTNKAADCGIKDTCQDVALFNASRPPTSP
jgi:hypothetical protein